MREIKLIWKLIIIMSFCLNIFGSYAWIGKQFNKMGWVRREKIKLAYQGMLYRYGWRR